MKNLNEALNAENFDLFNKTVSTLAKKAAKQNQEAMQLLIYLKQQINPAYRQIICPPKELAKEIYFTPRDFETLVHLYREQQAAREEENLSL